MTIDSGELNTGVALQTRDFDIQRRIQLVYLDDTLRIARFLPSSELSDSEQEEEGGEQEEILFVFKKAPEEEEEGAEEEPEGEEEVSLGGGLRQTGLKRLEHSKWGNSFSSWGLSVCLVPPHLPQC